MLNQPTIEKLHAMKLHGMADAFRAQLETAGSSQLSFEERFALLVDQQWLWKENRALARRFPDASLVLIGSVAYCPPWFAALPNVHLLGHRPYEELPRYLAGLDVLLLPYLAVIAVDVPLIAVAFGAPLRWPARVVVITAVMVTGLVAVRQFVAFRENTRLLRQARIQEERLQHEVSHDGLTGLANRALFRSRLREVLAAANKASVLLIDLDDFKTVNDLLGHDVGDHLLVSIAELLRVHAEAAALD